MTFRRLLLGISVGVTMAAVVPAHVNAQEFPDSLWNYAQTPWINFVFGVAAIMDVNGFEQDQASKDQFGDLNTGKEGEIRGIRGLFTGQVFILGRSYDYLFAAAYRGFDRGFEQQDENSIGLFDMAVSVPLWSDVRANIGKQKEPFSHDRVQSMLYGPSHERPAHIDAMTRSRNDGILIERWNREARWKWAIGYYNDWLSPGGLSFQNNPHSVIGRVTGLVIDEEESGGPLLHIGGSANYTHVPVAEMAALRFKPESFFAPAFIDTGEFEWDGALNLGLEAAFISGPWSVSGEMLRLSPNAPTVGDPVFTGWHAQVGWSVTGERRAYDRRWGVISSLTPESPTGIGGRGAWQLSARISHADAPEDLISGGTLDKYSVNLQWYLSRFTFMTFHGGYADLTRLGVNSGT